MTSLSWPKLCRACLESSCRPMPANRTSVPSRASAGTGPFRRRGTATRCMSSLAPIRGTKPSSQKGMKILITGGAGMIGSNLVRALVAKGNHVQVVDSLWRGRREHLQFHGDHTFDMQRDFFQLDLRQPGVVENIGDGFDLIFHLADIVAGINYVFANEGA